MQLTILNIDRHRNGVCGAPFTAIVFRDNGDEASVKLAIVFDEPFQTAVLDIAKLANFDVAFGSNSWRGDQYEPLLRAAIEGHSTGVTATSKDQHFGIGRLLAERREIALIWSAEDVQTVRPDLSEAQSWEVLRLAEEAHDANFGVNWDSMEAAAEKLFGPVPVSAEGGEVSHAQ